MPSPRAVLADIHDLKLDPNVAHTGIKASGHLHKKGAEAEKVVDEKPVKSALVQLPEPPAPSPPVEAAKPEPEAEPVAAKKQPPPPKKAKKDKPEEPKADDSKPEEEPSAS